MHCGPCNSQREGATCWKCGAETHVPHPSWTYPSNPPIERIRELAKEVGYALGVHGSLERDLDVIAAPWTAEAVSHEQLLAHICEGLGATVAGGISQRPHGRSSACIHMQGWYKLIDISICATAQ